MVKTKCYIAAGRTSERSFNVYGKPHSGRRYKPDLTWATFEH